MKPRTEDGLLSIHTKAKGAGVTGPARLAWCEEERWKYLFPRLYEKGVRRRKAATWHSGTWRKSFGFLLAGEDLRGTTEPPRGRGHSPAGREAPRSRRYRNRGRRRGRSRGPGRSGPGAPARSAAPAAWRGGEGRGGPRGRRRGRGVRAPRWTGGLSPPGWTRCW